MNQGFINPGLTLSPIEQVDNLATRRRHHRMLAKDNRDGSPSGEAWSLQGEKHQSWQQSNGIFMLVVRKHFTFLLIVG